MHQRANSHGDRYSRGVAHYSDAIVRSKIAEHSPASIRAKALQESAEYRNSQNKQQPRYEMPHLNKMLNHASRNSS